MWEVSTLFRPFEFSCQLHFESNHFANVWSHIMQFIWIHLAIEHLAIEHLAIDLYWFVEFFFHMRICYFPFKKKHINKFTEVNSAFDMLLNQIWNVFKEMLIVNDGNYWVAFTHNIISLVIWILFQSSIYIEFS